MTIRNVKGFLIDIDGVLSTGDTAIPGAREALALLKNQGYPFRCVSNSTRRCRATIAARLETMGFDIPEHSIFTPPLAAVRYCRRPGNTGHTSLRPGMQTGTLQEPAPMTAQPPLTMSSSGTRVTG